MPSAARNGWLRHLAPRNASASAPQPRRRAAARHSRPELSAFWLPVVPSVRREPCNQDPALAQIFRREVILRARGPPVGRGPAEQPLAALSELLNERHRWDKVDAGDAREARRKRQRRSGFSAARGGEFLGKHDVLDNRRDLVWAFLRSPSTPWRRSPPGFAADYRSRRCGRVSGKGSAPWPDGKRRGRVPCGRRPWAARRAETPLPARAFDSRRASLRYR